MVRKLQNFDCKVSAIVGDGDDDVFIGLLKETKEQMPRLKVSVLEGRDHWAIIEKPNEMYEILMEFLREIRGADI